MVFISLNFGRLLVAILAFEVHMGGSSKGTSPKSNQTPTPNPQPSCSTILIFIFDSVLGFTITVKMELEVVGRHALLFDDDAMAAFVNSSDALLQWNSLLIDRYDVRHLIDQAPPPPKKRQISPLVESDGVSRTDLDHERFQDLPIEDEENHNSESVKEMTSIDGGTYQAVGFSYGNGASGQAQNSDSGIRSECYHPPFHVPESLLNSLPPTEKVHQIISRTAKFVREHGGQSEIVLRVKQGDNPTFGFLMPDHDLHPYFRYLVDHQDRLIFDKYNRPKEEKNEGGALSLLGSVYGDDDDVADQAVSELKGKETVNNGDAMHMTSHVDSHADSSASLIVEKVTALKHPSRAASGRTSSFKNKVSVSTLSTGKKEAAKKREAELFGSFGVAVDKPQTSFASSSSEGEPLILEPPSSIKRMVDRIVEFILRNGKESEAILVEQNNTHQRFPFLLPSDQYHPYYLKSLSKAQEKHDPQEHIKRAVGHVVKKKNQFEGAYDIDRKEKFKMVIGNSKRGSEDPPSKNAERQCGVSADAAAAIVMEATRGLKNPRPGTPLATSPNDSATALCIGEGGFTSSIATFSFSYQANSSISKPISNGLSGCVEISKSVGQSERCDKSSDVSLAKVVAQSAALAAASEADSSEAGLTKEQKQKAERLKRAKMFSALIKSGSRPSNELLPGLSLQRRESARSDLLEYSSKSVSNHSGGGLLDPMGKEREGSSAPVDADKLLDKRKISDDDSDGERRSRKLSSKSPRHEEDSDADHKHSRKRHRSHHSSRHGRDHHRHRKNHGESRQSRHRRKHHSSSDEDEHRHRGKSERHRRSHEGEQQPEVDGKLSSNLVGTEENAIEEKESKLPDATEVPDELRAKVRAMLLATL